MKAIVVSGYAPSLVNFRGHLMKDMVDRGLEVLACAPEIPGYVADALTDMGVGYRNILIDRTGTNPVSDLRTFFDLKNVFEVYKPDLCLFYNIKPVIYGSLAARVARVPRIFSIITGAGYVFGDSSIQQKLLKTLVLPFYKLALGGNTKVFFQNPDDQECFLRQGLVSGTGQCVLINGSGVDTEHYSVVSPVTERIVFLLISRLISEKGIYEYVEAARAVKRTYPKVVFRLLGPFDSNPTGISEDQVEVWHNEGTIEYLGATRDVRPFIAESSVFVLPSYREGTPRTVLEAMSMGRPIITTDAPGCRETVIHGKNGYLVPVRDVDVLVQAMERFILNPEIIPIMGRESRKIAVDKYGVRKVNKVILDTMGLS